MATKIIIFIFVLFLSLSSHANELVKVLNKDNNYAELKIIDKITSRLTTEKVNIKIVF